MTIKDYCGPLQMFEAYDINIINMIIEEMSLIDNQMFSWLNDINIGRDVEFFWYNDSNDNVLGGFHMLSKNVIYINLGNNKNELYLDRSSNITKCLPTIVHELKHYYQRKKLGLVLYGICQLPFVRNFTIEVSTNKISDYLCNAINTIIGMSIRDFAKLKVKYKFPKWQFDDIEKKLLEEDGEWKR
jgi:hypothetical protein